MATRDGIKRPPLLTFGISYVPTVVTFNDFEEKNSCTIRTNCGGY